MGVSLELKGAVDGRESGTCSKDVRVLNARKVVFGKERIGERDVKYEI